MTGRLETLWDEPMEWEEFARREADGRASVMGPEGESMRDLMEWFCRRYPTPLARMRYVRRHLASIQATQKKIRDA